MGSKEIRSLKRKIKTYNTRSFTDSFIMDDIYQLLKLNYEHFFVVRVEEMLRMVKLPVPPSRATSHTLIFLTSGEANMCIGGEHYTISKGECFAIPAGQIFSFEKRDVNTGYLFNFQNAMVQTSALFISFYLGKSMH